MSTVFSYELTSRDDRFWWRISLDEEYVSSRHALQADGGLHLIGFNIHPLYFSTHAKLIIIVVCVWQQGSGSKKSRLADNDAWREHTFVIFSEVLSQVPTIPVVRSKSLRYKKQGDCQETKHRVAILPGSAG